MKKKVMITALALLTAGMCSCGKSETPAVTAAPQPTKSYQELNFPDVDWNDSGFNEAVNRFADYTETDIMGMATACAKGVAKSKGCTFDEAWDASYAIVSELVETGRQLKNMLILGSATWGVPEKENALTAGARFIELNNEISGYTEASDTSVESEILAIMSENASKDEETETDTAEEEHISINWDDSALIDNITAFAGYNDARLAHATAVYRKGLAVASGSTEEEVSEEVTGAVSHAKESADIVSNMLPYRENWAPELERAMSVYVSDFMEFAEVFGEYASLASQVKPDTTAETTTDTNYAETFDTNTQDKGDETENKGSNDDGEHLTSASEM